MGLAFRIIPMILTKGGYSAYKGRKFNADRSVGSVQSALVIHQTRGVDEMLLLDVAATPSHREPNFGVVSSITAACFMPITVGGGVKTPAHVRRLLEVGADKIAVGAAARKQDFGPACKAVGSQAMVAIITYSHEFGGELIHAADVKEEAQRLEKMGFGEIVLNCADRDGMMNGYDLATLASASRNVDVPVIAAGGCGDYADMLVARQAGASGVAVGSLFNFTDATPQGAARYLYTKGVETRLQGAER